MLGVAQEVVAPADGIVGASLVEPGQAVEYGQELIVIELAARAGDPARAGDAGRSAERIDG
jgi:pyruvate/2-oxoglutarate dehydrogenase complex dihydrolipoamide acyltransferase (E2) component